MLWGRGASARSRRSTGGSSAVVRGEAGRESRFFKCDFGEERATLGAVGEAGRLSRAGRGEQQVGRRGEGLLVYLVRGAP